MAHLIDRESGRTHPLPAEAILGRSSACEVQLQPASISSRHALLRWRGGAWELRDLGSRNGTWVDDRRLEPGEVVVVTAESALRLADVVVALEAGAPEAWAEGPNGVRVFASSGLLSLPPDADLAQIYVDATLGWVLDQGGELVGAPGEIELAGQIWRIFLPEAANETATLDGANAGPVRLNFQVSPDEEWAGLTVVQGGVEIPLQPRVHHYLLLTLARERAEDAAKGLEEAAQGWITQERLARSLRIPAAQVSLQVFRARRQLAEAGVANAAAIVERRSRTGQLRLGNFVVNIQAMSG